MQEEQNQHRKRLYNFASNFSGKQRHTRCIRFHSKVATKCVKTKQSLLSNESSSIEECYDARCCINYGDIRQVRVQFHSSSFQSCDFYWRKCVRRFKSRRKHKRDLLLSAKENECNLSEQEELLDNPVFWGCDESEICVQTPLLKPTHEFGNSALEIDNTEETDGKKTLNENFTLMKSFFFFAV